MTDNFFENFPFDNYYLPYSGKVGGDNVLVKVDGWRLWNKVWQMNKSANSLLIVTTNLNDFS